MSCRPSLALTLYLGLLFTSVASRANARTPAEDCLADLEVLPTHLQANDSGAGDHLRRKGHAVFNEALQAARVAAEQVAVPADCGPVLNGYLRTYRAGHLGVAPRARTTSGSESLPIPGSVDRSPTFQTLSRHTSLITLPSFHARHTDAVQSLVARHWQTLTKRDNLIIDVRQNDGGSDSTYASLLPLIEGNVYHLASAEFLATPENIAASERICALYAPGRACDDAIRPELTAMRGAVPGQYVLLAGVPQWQTVAPARVYSRPRRVAVMIDRSCGSSCEEFVLAARQSFKVKVIGRNTSGSLDYSNLRPYPLPSGNWWLFYATSRSTRLPHSPVDVAGIPPDLPLPAPADATAFAGEVDTVRRLLEDLR